MTKLKGEVHEAPVTYTQSPKAFWTPARMRSARDYDRIKVPKAQLSAMAKATVHRTHGAPGRVGGVAPSRHAPTLPRRVNTDTACVYDYSGNCLNYPPPLLPFSAIGKIFFTTHDGQPGVCSGSVVNSGGKDLVITAGHCVYGDACGQIPSPGEGEHQNFSFVPDYYNDGYQAYEPYGQWTAGGGVWPTVYEQNTCDMSNDIAALKLDPDSSGNHIADVTGSLGIAWNQDGNQEVHAFGYLGTLYGADSTQYCQGSAIYYPQENAEGIDCSGTLSFGASGGPWLAWFDTPPWGDGTWSYVNSVTSFGTNDWPGYAFGPYFGDLVRDLYYYMYWA
jgi:hypothetical protein